MIDNKNKVGFLGRIHPKINKDDIYVLELSLDKIDVNVKPLKYKPASKFPSIKKYLAFVVPKTITSEEIEKAIKRAGSRLLTNIELFDLYEGENIGLDNKSLAYNLTFSSLERTLTDEEVTIVFNNIIKEVESKLDAKLRSN